MNINRHKFIHYLLIVLLTCAPFRSVMALQTQACHSGEDAMASHSDYMSAGMNDSDVLVSVQMDSHAHHQSMMMEKSAEADIVNADSSADVSANQCCCDDHSNCQSGCDMGTMASLIVQQSLYSPILIDASESVMVPSSLLVRELTPPSRPPASIS